MPGVITGQHLKEIRARARLTNQQLADLLEETLSTTNRMLARGVRPDKEPRIREILAPWLPPTEPDRYAQMSDAALLAEMNRILGIIGQRLDAARVIRDHSVIETPHVESSDDTNINPDTGGTAADVPPRKSARGWGAPDDSQ